MASGNSLLSFEATAYAPPATSYATPDVRNAIPVLDFDPATEENAYFLGVLPRIYSGLGITVRVHWMATTAVSGGVLWAARFERHDDTGADLDADSFGTIVAAQGTAAAVSGRLTLTDLAFTNAQIDGLLAGEHFRLHVIRVAADALDTMLGDAELLAIELRET